MATFPRGLRIACGVMGAYFVFATIVQVNDPDAPIWLAFYGAVSAVTIFGVHRAPPWPLPAVLGAISLAWGASELREAMTASFPELFSSWQMMSPGMEIGREFLGHVIVVVWTALLAWRARWAGRGRAAQVA